MIQRIGKTWKLIAILAMSSLNTSAAVIHSYDATTNNPTVASEVVDLLTVDGGSWTATGVRGARDIVEGVSVVDSITGQNIYAWKTRDDNHNNNPGYSKTLTASDMQNMWDNGWKLTAIIRLEQGGHFYSWGTSSVAPAGTYASGQRRGINITSSGSNYTITPVSGGSTYTVTGALAQGFVKIVMLGRPAQQTWELQVYDLNDNLLNRQVGLTGQGNAQSASIALQSGSSSGDNRELLVNKLELATWNDDSSQGAVNGILFQTGFNSTDSGVGFASGLPVSSTGSNVIDTNGGLGVATTEYTLPSGTDRPDVTMTIDSGSVDTWDGNGNIDGNSKILLGWRNNTIASSMTFDLGSEESVGVVSFMTRQHNTRQNGTLVVSGLSSTDTELYNQKYFYTGNTSNTDGNTEVMLADAANESDGISMTAWKLMTFDMQQQSIQKIKISFFPTNNTVGDAFYVDALKVTDFTSTETQTVIVENSFETIGANKWNLVTTHPGGSTGAGSVLPGDSGTIVDAYDHNNTYELTNVRHWQRTGTLSPMGENNLLLKKGNAAALSYFILKPTDNSGIGTISIWKSKPSSNSDVMGVSTRLAGEDDSAWKEVYSANTNNYLTIDVNQPGNLEVKFELKSSNNYAKGTFLDSLHITNYPAQVTGTDSAGADNGIVDVQPGTVVELAQVAVLDVSPEGLAARELQAITLNLDGSTDVADFGSIKIYTTGTDATFDIDSATLVATHSSVTTGDNLIIFDAAYPLDEDSHNFWVVATTATFLGANNILAVQPVSVQVNDGPLVIAPATVYSATISATPNALPTMDNLVVPSTIVKGDNAILTFDLNDLEATAIDVTAIVTNGSVVSGLPIIDAASGSTGHSVELATTVENTGSTLTIDFTVTDADGRISTYQETITIISTNSFETITTEDLTGPVAPWLGSDIVAGATMTASAGVTVDETSLIDQANALSIPVGETLEFNLSGTSNYVERLSFKTRAKTADSVTTVRLETKQTAGGTYDLVYEGDITSLSASVSEIILAVDQLGADLYVRLTNVAVTGGDGNLYIDKTTFIDDAYLTPSSPRWSSENGDYFAVSGISLNGTALTSGTMHNDQNAPAPEYQTGSDTGYDYYINWNRILTPVPTTGLRPGADYALTLTESGGTFSGKLRYYGWLDSNGDGEFTTDELLFETGTKSGNSSFDQAITIPASAVQGATRLRVRCTYNWDTDGSSHSVDSPSGKYGEVEDYIVVLDDNAAVLPILDPAVMFTDNMVIQRNKDIRVWGEGNNIGQTITATLKNSSDVVVATGSSTVGADLKYNFDVTADLAASTDAHTLDLVLDDGSNSTTITYSEIVIGDVWIASGQSNMKLTVSEMTGSTFGTPIPAELAPALFPNVRLVKTGTSASNTPNENPSLTNGSWIKATSGVGSYSAVAYFYAAYINKATTDAGSEVPICVVVGAIGGTEIEEWMDQDGLNLYESYAHAKNIEDGNGNPDGQLGWTTITPANCFNGTLHATLNLASKGFIWYQGEYNFGNAARNGIANYGAMLQDLCRRWRAIFNVKDAEAPFYVVELAPHRYDSHAGAADSTGFGAFKQGMREILKLNNTGIALIGDDVTSNIEYTNHGGTTNVAIHPGQKAPVGERLSRIAVENVYGITLTGDATGPVATTASLDGTTLTVNFNNGTGLNRADATQAATWLLNDNLPFDAAAVVESRFEVATQDGVFTQVDWTDIAYADNTITLSNVSTETVHVRYGYEEWANINVKNSAGIPAGSFSLSTVKTGNSERAVQFPLSSGTLTIDPGTKLATVRGMTVEAWIKPDTPLVSPRVDTIISRWVDGSSANSSFLFSKDADNALTVTLQPYDGTAAVSVETADDVLIDEDWQHVAFTYSSLTGEVNILVDGYIVKTETHPLLIESNHTTPLYIGSSDVTGTDGFYGGIDEVKIWTRSLSASEILANVTTPLTPAKAQSMPELFAAYNFDYAEPVTRSGAIIAYDLNGGQLNANTDGTATLPTIPQAPILTPVVGIEVIQTEELLTWTIQDEVGVKEYRVIDANSGAVLQVITADGSLVYQVVLPEGVDAKLVVVDNSGFTQTFYPNNGSEVTVEYNLAKGWNLITLPGYNASLSALNRVTTGDFWTWNGSSYEVTTRPDVTEGFWVYAESAETVIITAEKSSKEITLATGWNLVGPVKNCYAPEEASIVYAWNEIYEQILENNILVQGVGYWMFSF